MPYHAPDDIVSQHSTTSDDRVRVPIPTPLPLVRDYFDGVRFENDASTSPNEPLEEDLDSYPPQGPRRTPEHILNNYNLGSGTFNNVGHTQHNRHGHIPATHPVNTNRVDPHHSLGITMLVALALLVIIFRLSDLTYSH